MADVVRIITRLNIGGPSRQAILLTRGLRPEFDTVLVAGSPEPDEGEMRDPSVPVHDVDLVRPLRPRADVRAFRQVRRFLVQHRPQIVHTHMAKAGFVGRLAAASLRSRPRSVHTYHGHVLEGYFGRLATRSFLEAERALARVTDVLIAISPEIRDELLDLGIGRPSQYRVIRLGFDLREHRSVRGPSGVLRAQLGLGADVPLVGIVGRLVPIKDHLTAFKVLAGIAEAHLAVVGDGEMRTELEAAARAMGLGGRVHFTGWRLDVPAVMADLDVVLLTSRNEGTPVSLIEAAACARPVVATDVGGVRSVVRPGETGHLAARSDVPALQRAVQSLLRDPTERARLGEAGRAASIEFSEERLRSEIRDLYRDLVSGD